MKTNYYFEAVNRMEEIQEEKEKLLLKAADTISIVIVKMNRNGITDMKAIEKDITKLISKFNDEEKIKILERAICKLVLNL